jgi:hypothetical protein
MFWSLVTLEAFGLPALTNDLIVTNPALAGLGVLGVRQRIVFVRKVSLLDSNPISRASHPVEWALFEARQIDKVRPKGESQ